MEASALGKIKAHPDIVTYSASTSSSPPPTQVPTMKRDSSSSHLLVLLQSPSPFMTYSLKADDLLYKYSTIRRNHTDRIIISGYSSSFMFCSHLSFVLNIEINK